MMPMNLTGAVAGRGIAPSTGTNGITGQGQTQPGAGIEAGMQTTDKGGMRGVGLLAIVIAELALKKEATDLAEDYYNLNKKDYDFFLATHQTPIATTVAEAMSPTDNPLYKLDSYASAAAGMSKVGVLERQWFEARRRVSRYAVGLQKRIDYDFAIARTHGIMSGWNVARRYELTYRDEHNNRRFDRKIEAANMGIGVGNVVRTGLASAVGRVTQSLDGLGDTVASIGNGWAQGGGYKEGRRYAEGKYPGGRELNKSDIG